MANHFPAVPGDLQLSQITYLAWLPSLAGSPQGGGSFYSPSAAVAFGTGGSSQEISATVAFPVPGSFGSFDQDAFEVALAACITSVLQAGATALGVPLAPLQGQVMVQRNWQFASALAPAFGAGYGDTMAYPPA